MKALIAYDSVSSEKNTRKVAEALRDALRLKGVEADSFHADEVDAQRVAGYDCLVVGSPTMAWRPTPPVVALLDRLAQRPKGGSAAAFDTRVKSILSGGAAGQIEGRLRKLGFKVAAPATAFYVKGGSTQGGGNFKLIDGELDKATEFAAQLAAGMA